LSERLAIQFFSEGKIEEAIDVYQQLKEIEISPKKITYYNQQIKILES
jgi:hypothetical protein